MSHSFISGRQLLFLAGRALPLAQAIIGPEAFFRYAHQRIFAAIVTLSERREMIDLVPLKNELERIGELDDVGGPSYLASLIDGVPFPMNVEAYARIVRDKWALRRLVFIGQKLVSMGYEGDISVEEIISSAERHFLQLSREHIGSDVMWRPPAGWVTRLSTSSSSFPRRNTSRV